MYIIDDDKSEFIKMIWPMLVTRGVDLQKVSELDHSARNKNSGIYITIVDDEFDCMKDQNFINFFKQHKFKRAVLLKTGCDTFKISNYFNSAVTILEIPSKLECESLLHIFYIHFFLEIV